MRDFHIEFRGEQNHAGTTPMLLRKDAGAALLDYCHEIRGVFPGLMGERTVFTIGQVQFFPGAPSIIPGKASMILQFRDPDGQSWIEWRRWHESSRSKHTEMDRLKSSG
jgi:N-carbamoyl-L-amino-acid hydrolase